MYLDHLGYNDDGLTDGDEFKVYFGHGGEGTGENEVLARITVDQGALSFSKLLEGSYNGSLHKIFYNEDILSDDYVEYEYLDNGTQYSYTSSEFMRSFRLRDGSEVTRVIEGENIYLIVWDTFFFHLADVTTNGGTTTIHCRYVRFKQDQMFEATYSIEAGFRGKDIYFSEPCSYDSDWDRILDGMEISWNENSDGDHTGRELEQLGTDLVYKLRDRDPDNAVNVDPFEVTISLFQH
ncbi:MAG: hypothetical protein QCI82_11230 [Candidatus Thermoplasmatota archaeon]|nr:hypothetical protein [Candidatus Thermoplasmatota archaeon]